MFKFITVMLLAAICFASGQMMPCYALEWKRLHEQADTMPFQDIQAMAQANQNSAEDLYRLGLSLLNMHRDQEAQDAFNKVLALNSASIEAKWGIAEVKRRKHQLDESRALLNAVIKSDPGFLPAYLSLAYIEYIQANFSASLRLAYKVLNQGKENVDLSNYVRALLLISGNRGMLAYYGWPLSKLINGIKVLPSLKKAQLLQPNSAAVMFGLGSFYFLAPSIVGGDWDKAKDYLTKAVTIDPQFCDAYVRLAQLYNIKGDKQEYQALLNKALEIDPQNEFALDIKNHKCKFICTAGER